MTIEERTAIKHAEYLRDGKIDPETGILYMRHWGSACARGFISDARFGSDTVIKRTDRSKSRKWRRMEGQANGAHKS